MEDQSRCFQSKSAKGIVALERDGKVRKRSDGGVAHFRVSFRFFVGVAGPPIVGLSREATRRLPSLSGFFASLVSGGIVESAAILPPSFSQRSSILFFKRFRAV